MSFKGNRIEMDRPTSTPKPPSVQLPDLSTSVISSATFPSSNPKSQRGSLKEKVQSKKNLGMLDIICKAIEEVAVKRKGASYIAIKNWVFVNSEKGSGKRFLATFKRAFASGLEKNSIIRKRTQDSGLRGHFLLNKELKQKAKKPQQAGKQAGKLKPPRVSNAVLTAKKKKKLAIMNGSLIQKRKSLLLNSSQNDSVKAKRANNKKYKNDTEKESGPSKKSTKTKASKKESKLPAVKKPNAAAQGSKQTKSIAVDDAKNQRLPNTTVVIKAKEQPKTVSLVKKQTKATTKVEEVALESLIDGTSVKKTEAPKRKQKTVSTDETKASNRKQIKIDPSNETEAPVKKQPKPKAKKNTIKTPGDIKESIKDKIILEDTKASANVKMKTGSSEETKKRPKSKATLKKKLETLGDSEVLPMVMDTTSEAETSATEQTRPEAPKKTDSLGYKQPKKKVPKSPSGKPNKKQIKAVNAEEVRKQDVSANVKMKTESSEETKKRPKPKATLKKKLETQTLSDSEVSPMVMDTTSEAETSATEQTRPEAPRKTDSLGYKQPKKKVPKSPSGEPNKKQMKAVNAEEVSKQDVSVAAKKQPKAVAQTSTSKKVSKNEFNSVKQQPSENRVRERIGSTAKSFDVKGKKPSKKNLAKLIAKIKVRKDLSDSELDVSRRTEPLKSYYSDPESSMMEF